jgi:adenosyl cobinamide kinase/adenosyl cobinamide phosphate guanylyltransferase
MALVLLTGGARSGKSRLAVDMAGRQDAPVVVVVTGRASDAEMAERIRLHRAERPPAWRTVEEPRDLAGALAGVDGAACLVVDCLSLWAAHALQTAQPARVEEEATACAAAAAARPGPTIAVTNEVGMGVVPATPLGRTYRDVLGRVNAAWARAARDAVLVVAGRGLILHRAEELHDRIGD